MIRTLGAVGGALVAAAGLALVVLPGGSAGAPSASAPTLTEPGLVLRPAGSPLAGVRVVLDPGHQLGNARFAARTGRYVDAGGFSKPCNSTGTSTNAGYPEASLTFAVAQSVKARLEALGATVLLTRTVNSADRWGPCVDARGRFGASVDADLAVSIHGDGAAAGARGFHVIAPAAREPWTTDIAAASRDLALAVRAGFDAHGVPRANYLGGGTALVTRADLGTLNLSDVPVVLLEVGNMRNRSDAARMTTYAGRTTYAVAVIDGIRRYLNR